MEPAGTCSVNPRSASTPSYCLRRSDVSMTNRLLTVNSCLGQRQRRLEQAPDLLVGDAAGAQPVHRGGDQGLAGAQLVGRLLRAGVGGDKGAGAVAQLDDPFVLQLAVGLG